jgi:hypothetical protein
MDTLAGLADSVKSGVGGATTVRAMEVMCERVPLVPVTATDVVPSVAVVDAVNVNVLVPAVDIGLKAAVTPAGKPLAVKATAPVNPPLGVTVMVVDAVPPRGTVTLAGMAESEKSGTGGAVTVSAMGVECVSAPLVQVMIAFTAPGAALLEAVRVSTVLVPVAGTLGGLKMGVTPAGKPVTVQATTPVNPPTLPMVIVLLPLVPILIDKLAGLRDAEKSGVGGVAFRSP